MKGKILFVAGLGVGYLLGTRAGRERYEQIKAAASSLWNAPVVQQRVDDVQEFVRERAPEVVEFVTDGAKKVAAQVSGRTGGAAKSTSRSGTRSGTRTTSKSSSGSRSSSSTKKPASGSDS